MEKRLAGMASFYFFIKLAKGEQRGRMGWEESGPEEERGKGTDESISSGGYQAGTALV